MAEWRTAAGELAAVHRRELQRLSDDEALRAAEAVLALAIHTPVPGICFPA
jgi:hypothetical protein